VRSSKEKNNLLSTHPASGSAVVLDLNTYERLCEAAEDNSDLRAYRAAKPRVDREIARGDFKTLESYRAKHPRKQK
jgi:hypothetical protein